MRAWLFAACVAAAVLEATGASAEAAKPADKCPVASVNATPAEKGATTLVFAVDRPPKDVTYNWSVSAGTISSGQGTSVVMVDVTGLGSDQAVTATVEIGGLDPSCVPEHTVLSTTTLTP